MPENHTALLRQRLAEARTAFAACKAACEQAARDVCAAEAALAAQYAPVPLGAIVEEQRWNPLTDRTRTARYRIVGYALVGGDTGCVLLGQRLTRRGEDYTSQGPCRLEGDCTLVSLPEGTP